MSRVRLGVSSCIFHADKQRSTFNGRPLLFAEESMFRWLMTQGAMPVLLPRASGLLGVSDLIDDVDGLVLQAGVDMSPAHYGEAPAHADWAGDAVRDAYEMELIRACMAKNKPVLGVCRGLQVINVLFGGSLVQDIPSMHPTKLVHRDAALYEQNFHDVVVKPDTWLAGAYGGPVESRINTVHHQCIKQLGKDLVVEAVSPRDGIIEAIRYVGSPFVAGVQWHPEFQDPQDSSLLPAAPLLAGFLREIAAHKETDA